MALGQYRRPEEILGLKEAGEAAVNHTMEAVEGAPRAAGETIEEDHQ